MRHSNWFLNAELAAKLRHRKAIASRMPQTKAEARKACFEAAQQHRITVLPSPGALPSSNGRPDHAMHEHGSDHKQP